MPRGPGKRENYNLDYARFNYLDKLDNLEEDAPAQVKAIAPEADVAAGHGPVDLDGMDDMPPMQELMQHVPPELREAYRLMALSKQTGDEKAQQRANELAFMAVERGGPKVKQDFINNIAKQAPEVAEQLRADLANDGPESFNYEKLTSHLVDAAQRKEKPPIVDEIDVLKSSMKSASENLRQQQENLQKQQDLLENLKSPEDIMKFMADGGLKAEDMQRMFSGDTAHMEDCFRKMLDKTASAGDAAVPDADKAVRAAEALHGTICGTLDEATAIRKIKGSMEQKGATEESAGAPSKPSKHAKKPDEPPKRTITIPEYRLQYQKDPDGRYVSVELKCSLPGVSDMASIVLDVSDMHIRLSTLEPAPGYVVNAGPFPVPIDDGACRAKYSKRREELSITVPAKVF